MNETKQVTSMTVAKASSSDVNLMREFLFELESRISDATDEEVLEYLREYFEPDCGTHFQRILFGYETLIENACDPNLTYLDWKPEIKILLSLDFSSGECTIDSHAYDITKFKFIYCPRCGIKLG